MSRLDDGITTRIWLADLSRKLAEDIDIAEGCRDIDLALKLQEKRRQVHIALGKEFMARNHAIPIARFSSQHNFLSNN